MKDSKIQPVSEDQPQEPLDETEMTDEQREAIIDSYYEWVNSVTNEERQRMEQEDAEERERETHPWE